jgi:iron complex transport system ATP-binding protein
MTRRADVLTVLDLALAAGGATGGRRLFDALSFEVRAGERWVLLGPNGAGKSSLLAALAGVFPVAAGRIALDGRALDAWTPARLADRRAWCPQFWSDPFPATVRATALLARQRRGWWQAGVDLPDPGVDALLDRLDLAALAEADVRTLSGGERQRVAIATTLLQDTPLLLLDEPASHLDLGHQQLLVQMLCDHTAAGGSVVASLHDLNLAWDLASHVVLLDGRGGCEAGPRDALMRPEFLGAVFDVTLREVEIGARRRFWSGVDAPSRNEEDA